jgi:hypothetical protein
MYYDLSCEYSHMLTFTHPPIFDVLTLENYTHPDDNVSKWRNIFGIFCSVLSIIVIPAKRERFSVMLFYYRGREFDI